MPFSNQRLEKGTAVFHHERDKVLHGCFTL